MIAEQNKLPQPHLSGVEVNNAVMQAIQRFREELNPPVVAILGYLAMIGHDLQQLDQADLVDVLDHALSGGRRLQSVVSRVANHDVVAALAERDPLPQVAARLRHDLRNPLTSIIGCTEALLEDLENLNNPTSEISALVQRDCALVLEKAKYFHNLIEHIVHFDVSDISHTSKSPVMDLRTTLNLSSSFTQKPITPGHLLVIDDNESVQLLLERWLTRFGHRVSLAASANEGFELLRFEPSVDLILLDLVMPDVHGLEMLLQLKASQQFAHLPVLMISGMQEDDAAIDCLAAGAEDFITKPFNPTLLNTRIRAALERKRARDREHHYLASLEKMSLELLDRDQRLRLLTDRLPFALVELVVSYDGIPKVSFLSAGIADIVNFEHGELKDQPWLFRDTLHRRDLWPFDRIYLKLLKQEIQLMTVIGVKSRDGQDRWIEVICRSHRREGGAMVIDGLVFDVTEHRQLQHRLQLLATADPLTNALNRRAFSERAATELARAYRYRQPFSIIALDIDHFKAVNDNYGHAMGDEVLVILVRTIESILRKGDLLGRYGGEEFFIALPQTEINAGILVAERIRSQVEQIKLSPVGHKPFRFTVSLGVVTIQQEDENLDMIMRRSDAALYAAKHGGRNRVVADQPNKQNAT